MSGLLPLFFALALLDTSHPKGLHPPPYPWEWWALVFAASWSAWLIICEGVTSYLARGAQRRLVERWDFLAQGLMLLWLGWICFGLGWTTRVEAYTPAILPWVVLQGTHWWCLAAGLRRPDAGIGTRYRMILHQIRFGMLPMLVMLPIFDCCNYLTLRSGLQQYLMGHLGPPITIALGSLALGAFALVGMPVVLVHLWHAHALPAGALRTLLLDSCRSLRVGVREIMLWPADGNRVYNAAVIGVLPRLRYVLFSQDLLADFQPRQILAVLGHELGHARYQHLPLYLLFAVATLLTSVMLAEPTTGLLVRLPLLHGSSPELREGLATVALLALKWRLIFGYLSRACERQADLAGAELCGDPLVMRDALRLVAELSGQAEDAPSWRHFSIRQRAIFLDAVTASPGLVARHHRQVRIWWWSLSALVLALSVILGIIAIRSPAAW